MEIDEILSKRGLQSQNVWHIYFILGLKGHGGKLLENSEIFVTNEIHQIIFTM